MPSWFGWNRARVNAVNDKEDKNSFDNDDTNILDDESPMYDDDLIDKDDDLNDKAQDLMADNLDMMRDIVFRIREDEAFAKSIYANCPRLQHLLKEHPDLRPIFEDPKLIRINFEKVYRDQGGVLPEDEDDEEPGFFKRNYDYVADKIAIITSHPLFKVFKFLMIIKKIIGFFSPSKGFSLIKGFFVGIFADPDAIAPEGINEADNGNPANLELKMQLHAAAEHMEDPEVQERMDEMLENPEMMDEIIENDPQLSALRDENELCAALMNNPDTMRILVDPENLRALAETPDLIEKDFADPDGFVPPEPAEPPALQTIQEVEAPEVAAPEGEEQESSTMEDIAESRENADDKGGNAAAKSRSASKKEEGKDDAKSWMQASVGVLGGQAISALGIGGLLSSDEPEIVAEAPPVGVPEGEAPLAEEVVPPEETEESVEALEMEMNADASNRNQNQRSAANQSGTGGGGGLFGAAMGVASGYAAGAALGAVISSDQIAMVTKLNDDLAERREAKEEADEKSRDADGTTTKEGRFGVMGIIGDLAVTSIGGVSVKDIADDVDELKDDDDKQLSKDSSPVSGSHK